MSNLLATINASAEAKEPTAQPEGQYKLVITGAKKAVGKESGKKRVDVFLNVDNPVNHPAALIVHMLMEAVEDDTDARKARIELDWKQFLQAFGITIEEMSLCVGSDDDETGNFDTLKGRTAWALLKEEISDEYGAQNRVTKFVSPE